MKKNIALRLICAWLSCSVLFVSMSVFASSAELSGARGAVLIDADTNEILWGRNENERLPMASTTKIMTALVALKYFVPSARFKIPKHAVGTEGTSASLCEGEVYSLEELLYALLLQSANDAACAIALNVCPTTEDFACLMNREASLLGLCNTHFTNPHGLPDDEHYTTAYELSLITSAALKNETIAKIVSTKSYKTESAEGKVRYFYNHNKLLSMYEGAIGVKTGYTKASGRCLVSSARRGGVTLIAVTLGSHNDWQEHMQMLDWGFSHHNDNKE